MEAATGQEVNYFNEEGRQYGKKCLSERNAYLHCGTNGEGTAGRTAQDISCQFLFVTGHLILRVCSMLCFVSGECQWSLEFSLHQGHKLILVFEVLYCHTFVMFSVSPKLMVSTK